MRVLAYVLIGALGALGLLDFFSGAEQKTFLSSQVSYAETTEGEATPKPWNGKHLLEMAEIYDQHAEEPQMEAVRLEQRAASLTSKPYLDPKGFRRTGLMHVAGARWSSG